MHIHVYVHVCMCIKSHTVCLRRKYYSIMSDSLRPHGPYPTGLLCPWDSPGKNAGMSSHSLLQGIFPTHGPNPGLLHHRQILYYRSHQGSSLCVYIFVFLLCMHECIYIDPYDIKYCLI